MRNLLALLPLLAACGSLHYELANDVPPPRLVAVLPFSGSVAAGDLDRARHVVRERLRVRNVAVLDDDHVDRVLSQRGWLGDPSTFEAAAVPVPELCAALGVEGVVYGSDLADSSTDLFLYYRRGFGGVVRWVAADGRTYWRGTAVATRSGGLLLKSGQLFAALDDYAGKGSAVASQQLIEAFADELLDTLPPFPAEDLRAPPDLMLGNVRLTAVAGDPRAVGVDVRATPAATVRVDLQGGVTGLPTTELEAGHYRAVHRAAVGAPPASVARVSVRDRFGNARSFVVEPALGAGR